LGKERDKTGRTFFWREKLDEERKKEDMSGTFSFSPSKRGAAGKGKREEEKIRTLSRF